MKYRILPLFIASFAVCAVFSSTVEAGPWTKSGGEYYLKVGHSLYNASEYRTGTGAIEDDIDYRSATTYTYGEIGLWNELHLQFYVPLMYAQASDGFSTVDDFGIGDTTVALQASPLSLLAPDLHIPSSIRLEAKLPFYDLPTDQTPARGDSQVDLSLWLSAGGGLHAYDLPVYFYADLGYRHRTRTSFDDRIVRAPDYSDAFVYLAEVGYTAADTVTVGLSSAAILPFSPDEHLDEVYVTAGPSVFWAVTDWMALEFDGYFTPYSRNSAAGWAVGAGVSFFRDAH